MIKPLLKLTKKIDGEVEQQLLLQAIKQDPHSLPLLLKLTTKFIELNKLSEAQIYIQEIKNHPECTWKQLFHLAKINFRVKEFEKTRELISLIPESYINNNEIRLLNASICFATKSYNEAYSIAQSILGLSPGHIEASLMVARLEHMNANFDIVIKICEEILIKYPWHISALEILVNARFSNNEGPLSLKKKYKTLISLYDISHDNYEASHPIDFNKTLNNKLKDDFTWILNPRQHSINSGGQILNILNHKTIKEPIFQRFKSLINQYITRYINEMQGTLTPYFQNVPAELYIDAWAVSLRTGEYQYPHTHKKGWISGVYYTQIPKVEEHDDQGIIEFGYRKYDKKFNRIHIIQPREGRLILFPSYYLHRTIPFEMNGERICISFDIFPKNR